MEKSEKFGFNLPSSNSDDIADINQISDNFRIIDNKVLTNEELQSILSKELENKMDKWAEIDADLDRFAIIQALAKSVQLHNSSSASHLDLYDEAVLLSKNRTVIAKENKNTGFNTELAVGEGIVTLSTGKNDDVVLNGVATPTEESPDNQAVNKGYVDEALKNIDISEIDLSGKMDKFGTVKKNGNNGQTIQLDTLTYLNDSNGQTVAMIGMSPDEVNINKNLGMMNKRIKNLGNPTDDTDAVNKKYVDTAIGSIDSALDSIIAIQNSILGGGA